MIGYSRLQFGGSTVPAGAAADPAHDDPHVRAAVLVAGAGNEYLYTQEAAYVYRDHFFKGRMPSNVAEPVVVPIHIAQLAARMFAEFLGHRRAAIVYSADVAHFAAVYSMVSAKDGSTRVAFYDSFAKPDITMVKQLRAALSIVNGGTPEEREVPDYVLPKGLGWQKMGGPCGVYAALVLRCIAPAEGAAPIEPSECENPPKMADVNREYEWLAENLPRLHKHWLKSF